MKKVICLVLSVCLLASMFASLQFVSYAETTNSSAVYPYNSNYSYGTGVVSFENDMIKKKYETWKKNYVTNAYAPAGTLRVKNWAASNTPEGGRWVTCSEGMGYGMLMAAYFDDRQVLDKLWAYAKYYTHGSTGLMKFLIEYDGSYDPYNGPATDGDEDMAMALVVADKKWGSETVTNYKTDATKLINNLYRICVGDSKDKYILNCGSWGGTDCTDPSYYATAWYKVFADYTGNSDWLKVVDRCYEVVANVNKYNKGTGIVPDFCSSDGTPAKIIKTAPENYQVSGDAFRYWWRVATDYLWFGDERAKAQSQMLVNYFKKRGGAQGIVRSYKITGEASGGLDPLTLATAGGLFMVTGDKKISSDVFNITKQFDRIDYYPDAWNIMGMMLMSGNLPNIYNGNVTKVTQKTVALKSVKPGTLTTKTKAVIGYTTANATVKLKSGSKTIKTVKANSKGKFTFSKLNLKKYKKKSLVITASLSSYKSATKVFAKIKK